MKLTPLLKLRALALLVLFSSLCGFARAQTVTLVNWDHSWKYLHPMGQLPPGSGTVEPNSGATKWYAAESAFTAAGTGYTGPVFGAVPSVSGNNSAVSGSFDSGIGAGPFGYDLLDGMDYAIGAAAAGVPTPEFTGFGTTLTVPASSGRLTAYFRTTFTVPAGGLVLPKLTYLIDDGAFVYLDGVLAARINMDAAAAQAYATRALNTNDQTVEDQLHTLELWQPAGTTGLGAGNAVPPSAGNATLVTQFQALAAGEHTLAISVHNRSSTQSSDLAMAVKLTAETGTNDFFASPAVLQTGQTASASNVLATVEAGELRAPTSTQATLWWSWQAPAGARAAQLTTEGSDFDTTLSVWRGNTLASLELIAADNDSGAGSTSSLVFRAYPEEIYRIAAGGNFTNRGTVNLRAALVTPPGNDDFVDAGDLSVGTAVTGDNTNATLERDEVKGTSSAQATLWWRWLAPAGVTSVTATTAGSSMSNVLTVFTGASVTALTPLGTHTATSSFVAFPVQPGTGYHIAVAGNGTARGAVSLNLLAAPSNDHFAGAAPLYPGITASGNTTAATTETGEPNASSLRPSLWWRWQAPPEGGVYELSTAGSTINTYLGVYTGTSVTDWTLVEEDNRGGAGVADRIFFRSYPGVVYHVAVSGVSGARGAVALTLVPRPAPVNDDFVNAVPLALAVPDAAYNNTYATVETGEDKPFGGWDGSVWWRWTAPAGGMSARVETVGSSFDTTLGVYTGNAVDDLHYLYSDDDGGGSDYSSRIIFQAQGGVTYYFAVASYGYVRGNIVITLSGGPANDTFSSAAALTTGTRVTAYNSFATSESGEPLLNTLWWNWMPAAGVYEVTTAGSSFDTMLGVWTGSTLAGLLPAAVEVPDDDSGPGLASRLVIKSPGGITYRVAVGGYGGARGTINLVANAAPLALVMPNDDFANLTGATPTVLPTSPTGVTADNTYATRQTGEPSGTGRASLWWNWTPAVSGPYQISTGGTGFGNSLAVFTGTVLASLSPVGSYSANGSTSQATVNATAGTVYRVVVGSSSEARGVVRLTALPLATNYAFSDPVVINTTGTPVTGNNQYATTEGPEPLATPYTQATAWWRWTPASGGLFEVSTAGSSFNTTLALWTGTALNGLTLVAADDNSGPNLTSRIVFQATGGTEYRIAVGGHQSSRGTIQLVVRSLSTISNDDFDTPAAITPGAAAQGGDNLNATVQAGEPEAVSPSGATLWWQWTPTASGIATLSIAGSSLDATLGVFTGTALTELTLVASNDTGSGRSSSVTFAAVAGQTYRFVLGGYAGSRGNWQLALNVAPGLPVVRHWDGGGDGTTWGQAANWVGDVLPGPLDDVVIDVPGTTATVRITAGEVLVRHLSCQENLSILTNGNLTVRGDMTIFGLLTVAPGRFLTANGASATVTASSAVIDGACLFALNGGRISLTGVTAYARTQAGFTWLLARGARSVLSLPALASITGRNAAADRTFLQAQSGGELLLGACTQITGAVQANVTGANSRLVLTVLAVFTGNALADSGITCGAGGTLVLSVTLQVNFATFLVASGGVFQGTVINFLAGSLLCGSGRIVAGVTSAGLVQPGDGPGLTGVLTIEGYFTLALTGRIDIEIGGPVRGNQCDAMTVTGVLTATGRVTALLINGYYPGANVIFDPFSAPGDFPDITGVNIGGGQELVISYLSGVLRWTSALVTGPRVTAYTPSGAQQIVLQEFNLTFNKAVNPATFTPDKVTLTGPVGRVTILSVTRVSSYVFRIRCERQIATATYTLRVGPDIRDYAGNPMDETDDHDGKLGEPNDAKEFTVNLTTPLLPDLVVSAVSAPATALPGQTVTVQWTVTNQGLGLFTTGRTEGLFLSTDESAGGDFAVGTSAVTGTLAAGASQSLSQSLVIPADGPAGAVRFVVMADRNDDGLEDSESNNYAVAAAVINIPATLSLRLNNSALREGTGSTSTTATLARNGSTTAALTVGVGADLSGQLNFPFSVTIPAGQSSATFTVSAVNDGLVEPLRTIIITCTAGGFASGTVTLTLADDDLVSADLAPLDYYEDDGWVSVLPAAAVTTSAVSGFGSGTVEAVLINSAPRQEGIGWPQPLPNGWNINAANGLLTIAGVPAATVLENSRTVLRLSLASGISTAALTQLLQAISFANVSQAPPVQTRAFRLTVRAGGLTTVLNRPINVIPVNDAPVIVDVGHETIRNAPVRLSHLLENDFDYEDDAFTISLPTAATANGGTVSLVGNTVVYTPPPGFTGTDYFEYMLTDTPGDSRRATIRMTVWASAGSLRPWLATVERLSPAVHEMRVHFYDIPDTNLLLQASSDLLNWEPFVLVHADTFGTVRFEESIWREKRYFRLRQP